MFTPTVTSNLYYRGKGLNVNVPVHINILADGLDY